MSYFTLFLVVVLQSNSGGDDSMHYSKIKAFESREACEFAGYLIMQEYTPPTPGVGMMCIRTDET